MTVNWNERFAERAERITSSAIREILKITQQSDIISFAGGLPAPELFPVEETKNYTAMVLERDGAKALQYSTTEGHAPLREWVASRYTGVHADNVQITSGSQQVLDLVGKMLLDEGDKVAVETPTYLGVLQAFNAYAPEYVSVPMDEDGMDTDALEQVLQQHNIKMLYAIPNFQNPTGRCMSLERRKKLVELTAKHGVIVLEDDPYGKLRFSGEELPTLLELSLQQCGDIEQSNIVYASSFSKTLIPGSRIAWVVAASPLIKKLIQAKQGADLHTSTLSQIVLYEMAKDMIDSQISKICGVYGERRDVMLDAIKAEFPSNIRHSNPEGGMFLWVELPETIDTVKLLERAVELKVAFVPGEPFHAHGGGKNTLRLSYVTSSPERIRDGIKRLGQAIRSFMD